MFGKKKCGRCGGLFTPKEFGGHQTRCRKCINSSPDKPDFQENIDRSIQRRTGELIRAKVQELIRERIDAPHPSEVSEAVYKEFGGITGLAKLYHEQVQAAITAGPGSKAVLDALKTIAVQMPESSARNRASAPDVGLDDMTDDELRRVVLENIPTDELELLVAKRKGLVIEMGKAEEAPDAESA